MSKYNFGQYNYNEFKQNIFIEPFGSSVTIFREEQLNKPYPNIGFFFNQSSFSTEKSYYFNGVIKKLDAPQEYRVYLGHISSPPSDPSISVTIDEKHLQPIAYLNIEAYAGTVLTDEQKQAMEEKNELEDFLLKEKEKQYQEIEFLFQPYGSETVSDKQFNCIIFSLIRNATDYGELNAETIGVRQPIILMKELDVVNNIVNEMVSDENAEIVKLSVSSFADFSMEINNEPIKTNKSGIYELVDGFIVVDNFGVYTQAREFYFINADKTNLEIFNGRVSDSENETNTSKPKPALDFYPEKSIFETFLKNSTKEDEDGRLLITPRNFITWGGSTGRPTEILDTETGESILKYCWALGAKVKSNTNLSESWKFNDFTVDYVYKTED